MVRLQSIALDMIARLTFREFTQADWMSFGGCESEKPLIAETDEYTIVIDGDIVEFFDADNESIRFELREI